MGGRYIITGTQIGTIKAFLTNKDKEIKKILDDIYENQFLGNSMKVLKLDLIRLSEVFNNK